MHNSSVLHQLESTTLQILVTKFIHFFAGRGKSPEFRGRGDSSERTGDTWGLPPPAGNTWLFSTCISHQCYINLNQPHFTKFIHFFAGRGKSPEFRGRGDSSERTGDTWGLPPPAGNTWLFSTCISRQCYTNLNQPHFTKFIHFFAGCSESPGFRGWGDSSETCGPPETETRVLVQSPKTRESSEGTQTEEEEEGFIGKWQEQEEFNEDEGTVCDMAKRL